MASERQRSPHDLHRVSSVWQEAEKFQHRHSAALAEQERLKRRTEEVQVQNKELVNMVNDLSNRLALQDTTTNGEVEQKMDELTRVYELLAKTEGKLNAAEGEAMRCAEELDRTHEQLQNETGQMAQLRQQVLASPPPPPSAPFPSRRSVWPAEGSLHDTTNHL